MKEIESNLWRGPRMDPLEIVRLGFRRVLSFQSGVYEATHDDAYENFDWEAHGIEHILLPMSDLWPPEDIQIIRAHRFMREAADNGIKTLIHCAKGVDRTGFVAASWRMRRGWTFKKGVAELKAEGMHWWYYWWIPFLYQFQWVPWGWRRWKDRTDYDAPPYNGVSGEP